MFIFFTSVLLVSTIFMFSCAIYMAAKSRMRRHPVVITVVSTLVISMMCITVIVWLAVVYDVWPALSDFISCVGIKIGG